MRHRRSHLSRSHPVQPLSWASCLSKNSKRMVFPMRCDEDVKLAESATTTAADRRGWQAHNTARFDFQALRPFRQPKKIVWRSSKVCEA